MHSLSTKASFDFTISRDKSDVMFKQYRAFFSRLFKREVNIKRVLIASSCIFSKASINYIGRTVIFPI